MPDADKGIFKRKKRSLILLFEKTISYERFDTDFDWQILLINILIILVNIVYLFLYLIFFIIFFRVLLVS